MKVMNNILVILQENAALLFLGPLFYSTWKQWS